MGGESKDPSPQRDTLSPIAVFVLVLLCLASIGYTALLLLTIRPASLGAAP